MHMRGIGILEAGNIEHYVAERLNVSQSVISRLWNRYLQAGNCQRRLKSGRPRCIIVRADLYLPCVAKRHRFQSAVN